MILTTSLSVPVLASDTHKTEGNSISNDIFEATEFTVETNGYVEHIIINENREIFVNGRNITTITSTTNNNIGIMSLSEDWIKAGTEEYHYNLGGLSVSAAVGILKKLGKNSRYFDIRESTWCSRCFGRRICVRWCVYPRC